MSPEHEALSLAHCRTPAARTPLFITLMVDELAHSDRSVPIGEKLAAGCLDYGESVELYRYILESLETDHEDATCRGLVKKVRDISTFCLFLIVNQSLKVVLLCNLGTLCVLYIL